MTTPEDTSRELPGVLVHHNGTPCEVHLHRYADGDGVAIRLVEAGSGEPYVTATANIPEGELQPSEVLLKDHSEYAGVPAALEEAGVVRRTGRLVRSGYVELPVAELLFAPPPSPVAPTMPYIVTFSGRRLYRAPWASDPPTLREVAINHARTPMYAGHTRAVGYVAHHCLAAEWIAAEDKADAAVRLYTLLHEAEVVAYGDVPGPMKSVVMKEGDVARRNAFLRSLGVLPPTGEQWRQVERYDKVEQHVAAVRLGFPESVHAAAGADTDLREIARQVVRTVYDKYPPDECHQSDSPIVVDFMSRAELLLAEYRCWVRAQSG